MDHSLPEIRARIRRRENPWANLVITGTTWIVPSPAREYAASSGNRERQSGRTIDVVPGPAGHTEAE